MWCIPRKGLQFYRESGPYVLEYIERYRGQKNTEENIDNYLRIIEEPRQYYEVSRIVKKCFAEELLDDGPENMYKRILSRKKDDLEG